MGEAAVSEPAPPPGFVLQDDTPPPPPGFVIDDSERQKAIEFLRAEAEQKRSSVGDISPAEAAIMGAAELGSFSHLGEVTGLVEGAKALVPGGESPLEAYRRARNEKQEQIEAAKAQHPGYFYGAGLPTAMATGAASGSLLGVAEMAPLTRIGAAVAEAGVAGSGQSEADFGTGQYLKDVGISTATGAGLSGLGEVARAGVGALGKYSKMVAGASEAAAAGATKADLRRISRQPGGFEKFGKQIRESGISSPWRSASKMGERAELVSKQAGSQLEEIAKAAQGAGLKVDSLNYAARVESEIIAPLTQIPDPAAQALAKKLTRRMLSIAENSEEGLDFNKAQKLKKWLDTQATSKILASGEPSEETKLLYRARGVLNDEIEKSIDRVGQKIGDPQMLEKLKAAKSAWGVADQVRQMGQEKTLIDKALRIAGPSEMFYGGAAFLGGDRDAPLTTRLRNAASGALIARLVRNHEKPLRAGLFRLFGEAAPKVNMLESASRGLRSIASGAIPSLGNEAAMRPGLFGQYAPMLNEAASKGDHEIGAVDFRLQMTDPEYRKKRENMDNGIEVEDVNQ